MFFLDTTAFESVLARKRAWSENDAQRIPEYKHGIRAGKKIKMADGKKFTTSKI
jgi:hypothetical protein